MEAVDDLFGSAVALALATIDGRRRGAALLRLGALLATVVAIKAAVGRERPDGSDARSFPSGHAAVAAFLAAVLADGPHRALVSAWAVLASAARVARRRHHASDVAVGACLGCIFSAFVSIKQGMRPSSREKRLRIV